MLRKTLLFVAAVAIAAPAFAHHGGGTFELNKTVSFTGAKLTKLEFLNPHGWLYFETTEADGKVQKHRCEMRSAHVLRRSGWSPELFKSGEKVDITASPDRADIASCYLQTIVFANGTRMDRYGQYVKASEGGVKEVRGVVKVVSTANRPARRPSGEPNIAGDWAPEQVVMADPRGVGGGLQRLSTIPQDPAAAAAAAAAARAARAGGAGAPGGGAPRAGGAAPGGGRGRGAGGPRMFNGAEVTELGEKKAAAFKPEDNPRFKCETTSIIFDWTFDGPVNRITQNKDTIVIQYGQLNLKRTVHMNLKTQPANVKLTRAGHSIGRWDGDTLVVDTVGFLPGVINGAIHHGEKMHVTERFTVDPKTWQLARTWELEDPEYLKGKAIGANPEVILPADAEYTEDKCKEQKDLDYSKVVAKK
jgi:hypothetical protein